MRPSPHSTTRSARRAGERFLAGRHDRRRYQPRPVSQNSSFFPLPTIPTASWARAAVAPARRQYRLQPLVELGVGRENDRHGLGVNRRDDGIGVCRGGIALSQ